MQSLSHQPCSEINRSPTSVAFPSGAATVLVVDQDVLVREALTELVRTHGLRCETFESPASFLSHPRPEAPHCLILDIDLPGFCGAELQRQMATRCRGVPIIFIAEIDAIPTTVRAMKPDELEFLARPFDREVMLAAIRKAISRSAESHRRELALDDLRRRRNSLTPRELEVMDLVVLGLQNKQVARRLDIAEITVKVHRGRVMEKMAAASFADLVKMSVELQGGATEVERRAITTH